MKLDITVAELLEITDSIVENHEAEKFVREEGYAIQNQHIDISDEATTRRAIEALQQPDTPWGRHSVARAWLKENA